MTTGRLPSARECNECGQRLPVTLTVKLIALASATERSATGRAGARRAGRELLFVWRTPPSSVAWVSAAGWLTAAATVLTPLVTLCVFLASPRPRSRPTARRGNVPRRSSRASTASGWRSSSVSPRGGWAPDPRAAAARAGYVRGGAAVRADVPDDQPTHVPALLIVLAGTGVYAAAGHPDAAGRGRGGGAGNLCGHSCSCTASARTWPDPPGHRRRPTQPLRPTSS